MNKSLPSRFAVSIPVKPYVKRFLDINFGLSVAHEDLQKGGRMEFLMK
jgi:hypothetical protein